MIIYNGAPLKGQRDPKKPKRQSHLRLVVDEHEGNSYEEILRRMKTYQLKMMLGQVDSEAEKRLIRVELRRRGAL